MYGRDQRFDNGHSRIKETREIRWQICGDVTAKAYTDKPLKVAVSYFYSSSSTIMICLSFIVRNITQRLAA
jgi:hypothetical protein